MKKLIIPDKKAREQTVKKCAEPVQPDIAEKVVVDTDSAADDDNDGVESDDDEESGDPKHGEHKKLGLPDMVIRYGMSETDIMKHFMHAGLPYHKSGSIYTFCPEEITEWEEATKCIFWEEDRFNSKYYDLINKKYVNRSEYAEAVGLETSATERYLAMKQKLQKTEAEKAKKEAFEKKKRSIIQIVFMIIMLGAALLYQLNVFGVDTKGSYICFGVTVAMMFMLMFMFSAFRAVTAFLLVAVVVAFIMFIAFRQQVLQGINELQGMSAGGGAAVINALGE